MAQNSLRVAVPTSSAAYLEERLQLLRQALDQTDALAGSGQLPDVELSSAGLKISPLENSVPKEADALRDALYGMLPHVKVTDLLMEVDGWTGFTRHFVHLKGEEIPRLCRGGSSSLTFTGVHPRNSKREPTKAHVKEKLDGPTGKSKPLGMGVQIPRGIYPEMPPQGAV
jgi:hypothetical protein